MPVISIVYIVTHTWPLCSAQILVDGVNLFLFQVVCFEWACQDFQLLKANLGLLYMPHPGMGP